MPWTESIQSSLFFLSLKTSDRFFLKFSKICQVHKMAEEAGNTELMVAIRAALLSVTITGALHIVSSWL